MKKIIKNISRVVFSLLLIVSIFGAFNVFAADVIFQITGISVKEKSDKVTVNDVSLSGGAINNDIVFTDQGDYITYDITIKNVTEDDYTIKSITDDNTSAYLEYTYDDLSNVKLNKGESKTFELTITYKQETSDLTITDKAVSLTLTYEKEDGTTGTETITNDDNNGTITPDDTNTTGEVKGATITNPKTGDNITIYIILGLVSLTGLVITTVSKKHLQKSLMAVALVSLVAIPLGVKADSDKFIIKFNNNIKDADFKITYNANGGKFSDNSTKKVIPYADEAIIKISHTENIDDTGKKLSDYGQQWYDNNIVGSDRGDTSLPHVITIPGASSLTIDVYYGGVDDEYYVAVMHEAVTDYNNFSWNDGTYHEYWTEENGTYEINGNTVTNIGYEQFTIDGNTVSFGFESYDSEVVNGYGYYATVKSIINKPHQTITDPTREGFIFKGWYDDPECTDGHEVDIDSINSDKVVYAKWKDPNVLELGDEYCIGDECFYYLRHQDSNHIVLYAKYPYNNTDNRQEIGHMGVAFEFANSSYWSGDSVEYPIDVYNGDNYLKGHINNYVDYLKTYNFNVEGRLLNYDDLVSIGVDFSKVDTSDSLANVPTWFTVDSTFTSVATSDYTLYRIQDGTLYDTSFSRYAMTGVLPTLKPVIVLEVDN